MMRKIKKLNNQGSTLLTVIICLAFIGILGSMMLSATLTNLQMKIVESKSKENFYSCEMAMEKIRVGVQEITAKAIKTVYEEKVLSNYATFLGSSESVINKKIQDDVVYQLMMDLGTVQNDMFNGFLLDAGGNVTEGITVSVLDKALTYATGTEAASVLINGIKVDYTKNGYETSITSNIRVTTPKFTFNQGTDILSNTSMEQPFKDYVLVADGDISSTNNAAYLSISSIKGSVYAGGDIIISGSHQVTMSGDNIVTRGNITVSDTAKLTIENASPSLATIWADNLVTQTSSTYDLSGSTLTTDININNGISIIKDDLVLEGRNSKVGFTRGAYIGYTGTHTSEGSAIMINGSGSSLDLSPLDSLILAGRAHVSIGDTPLNNDYILTGESVAFKSNQRAYLVPGKHITNILHNPVTEADIMPLGASTPTMPVINIINDVDPPNILYANYILGSLKPYKIAVKQTASSTLRYYYLNLGSGMLADKFLQEYDSKYPTALSMMEPFTLGKVTLPTNGVFSVGNIMSYPDTPIGIDKEVELTPGKSITLNLSDPTAFPDDESIDNVIANLTLDPAIVGSVLGGKSIWQLSELYSKMTHLLTLEDAREYAEGDFVVASSIISGTVTDIAGGTLVPVNTEYTFSTNDSFSDTSTLNKYFIVVDGNATIENGAVLNGILIASGDITIGDGAKINGMVISTGKIGVSDGNIGIGNNVTVKGRIVAANNISLGYGCTLEANNDNITPVFAVEGDILSKLFKNAITTVNFTTTTVDDDLLVDLSIANLITYENWSKN